MTVEEVVARVLHEPIDKIDDATSRQSLRSWNSLCHVELIIALEDAFGVKFSRKEISELTTVERIRISLREKGVRL
jgi:acyl carrier protein